MMVAIELLPKYPVNHTCIVSHLRHSLAGVDWHHSVAGVHWCHLLHSVVGIVWQLGAATD